MKITDQDAKFMKLALNLARNHLGLTAPNPSVGCIIVKDNQVISSGVTAAGGRPHAEIIALNSSKHSVENAIVYVTLEPCSHKGKEFSCADALIKAKVKKVIISVIDPDIRVNGKGMNKLIEAGIEVVYGLFENEAKKINEGFFKVKKCNLPFVTLKLATSLDGKIALKNNQSKWITCQKARDYTHNLRFENEAIMVGIGTVLADDPYLTRRTNKSEWQSLIRIVIDSNLSISKDAKLFLDINSAPLWIITNDKDTYDHNLKYKSLTKAGAKIIRTKLYKQKNEINLMEALSLIAKEGINKILVEGGSKIATSLIKKDLIDRLIWLHSSKIIGQDGLASIGELATKQLDLAIKFKLAKSFSLDNDIISIYDKYTEEIL